MFPLRDRSWVEKRAPVVTWALIAANVAAFAFEKLAMLAVGERFILDWGFIPARFLAAPLHDLPTLFSSMFLHGGILHLLGNMWFLHVFGGDVENELGRAKYLGFYLLSGLAAALAQMAAGPTSVIPMVGASGAIAGVLGAYALRFPKNRIVMMTPILLPIELPAWLMVSGWFVIQVVSGAAMLSRPDAGGVAFFAHAGGLVAGLVMMLLARPRRRRRIDFHVRGGLDEWRPPQARW